MKRINLLVTVALTAAFMFVGAKTALAADAECTALGGALNLALTECQINTSVTKSDTLHGSPSFNLLETLRICGPSGACDVPGAGSITVPHALHAANSLTINIAGKFIMEDGAKIIGDNGNSPNDSTAIGATITITAAGDIVMGGDNVNGGSLISSQQLAGSCGTTGRGGNISLITTGGNVTADDGSVITSSSAVCPAGDILITANPPGKIDLDGQVLARGLISGTGTRAGGGKITVIAGCDLTISDTGVLSSQGKDQGADLVHLEGCTVVVHGLVESVNVEGGGHADSVVNDNACNTNTTAHPQFAAGVIFTGCVEIWSGTTIVIDKTGGNNGEISVDGEVQNSSWIDLFANGDINIVGDSTGNYAVHGNPTGATNNTAALITIKSENGNVSASNLAIQADATGGGSRGGTIRIEAGGALALNTANISAQGDKVATGGFGFGGKITTRSFAGTQNWDGGVGEVEPTGASLAVANRGVVTIQVCTTGTETHAGTSFPITPGQGVQSNPVISPVGACGGTPDIPVTLPSATCTAQCKPGNGGDCEKASVKSVLNKDTGRFPSNLGPDLTFRLDLGQDEDGNTSIQQSITNEHDRNSDGYFIILVVKDGTGTLGGSTVQKVDISKIYVNTFALFGCSVTLIDPDRGDGLPAGLIETGANSPPHVGPASPGNIFVMDLHGADSEIAGWFVVGNGRYMRNVANKNNQTGIWFDGDSNTMHNGNAVDNSGVGIQVDGNGNSIETPDSFANGGCGIQVTGNSNTVAGADVGEKNKGNLGGGICVAGNSNILSENDVYANTGTGIVVVGNGSTIKKNDVGDRGDKGNGGDGIQVAGDKNTFQENDVFGNLGNGIWVSGNGNTFSKNVSGDAKKGNGGDGFHVAGAGNALQENKASANGLSAPAGDGDGFDISGGTAGSPNTLKSNQSNSGLSGGSGENKGAEYRLLGYVRNNGGGNKADGTTVPSASKCATTFPATNATVLFGPAAVCE